MSSAPKTDFGGHVTSFDRRSIRDVPGVVGAYGERVPMSAAAMHVPPGGLPLTTGPNGELVFADPKLNAKGGSGIQRVSHSHHGHGHSHGHDGSAPIQQAINFGPLTPGLHRPQMPIQGPGMAGGPDGAMPSAHALPRFPAQRTQVRFNRPSGMKVSWYTQGADGKPAFSNVPIDAPGRYNFPQGAIYRLKLSNIEGRPGLEVYPTMEVFPTNPKTESFLAHSVVPVEFTPDDFKQIAENSYVVKVIYLPDPQFQDVAVTGTEEILSTRLEPGVDPIQEAIRRGSILLVIRMGNIDQEAPNTPPLNAVAPGGGGPNPIVNFGPTQSAPPGTMVPFGPTGSYPGAPMPPGLMTAPTPLAPSITAAPAPLPRGNVTAIPTSRPGTATATSPLPTIDRTTPSIPVGPALR